MAVLWENLNGNILFIRYYHRKGEIYSNNQSIKNKICIMD